MALALALLAPVVVAQTPNTVETPTIPYVNKAFGFEMRLPAGWRYDHMGFFGPGGSLGVLRGAATSGQAALQILVFRELDQPNFREWIEYFSEQLGAIGGAKGVRVQGVDNAARPTANVVAEAQIGIERTRTLYHCVQLDEDTIWVFSYAETSRVSTEEPYDPTKEIEIPAELRGLISTLRVFYDPELARGMALALQRGKQYLAGFQLQEDIQKLRVDPSVRFYEIVLSGKPIGYLTRQFLNEYEPLQNPGRVTNAKPGMRVKERSYRFAEDGSVNYSQNDLFSSRDGDTDLYELSQIRIPPAGAPGEQPVIARDQCVRESDTLFSTYTTSRDAVLPEPRQPIKLGGAYLGLAWARVLPALIGTERTEPMAFSIYDAETRTLITQMIKPLGEKTYAGAPAEKVFAYEVREGFAETPGIAYADEAGNLLRIEAGPLALTLTDEGAIQKRYGKRQEEANLRVRQLQQP